MNYKNQSMTVFMIGMVVGILVWNILTLSSRNVLAGADGTTGGSSEGIIAVTGAISNSTAGLWIIDAHETETGPSICLYIPQNEGRKIVFSAARRIKYDLKLVQYNDVSPKDMSPSSIRTALQKEEKGNK